jgi:uncharacterized protein (DUF58 family)
MTDESLLSPAMTARLARLSLLARRLPGARRRGRRRTRRLGGGCERIDTRPYSPGDDPRRLAWAVYARLERLLVWLVADEAPLKLVVVVDTSASMGFGRPTKLRQAARLAAGLSAVALGSEDRVGVVAASDTPHSVLRVSGGRIGLGRQLALLDRLKPGGRTDLAAAATAATSSAGGRALCVLISDFFDPKGALCGARALRARGHELALCEVLAPFEIDPPNLPCLEIEDSETGELVELPFSDARAAYHEAFERRRALLDAGAAELGAPLLRVSTAEPFDALILRALGSGLLRGASPS